MLRALAQEGPLKRRHVPRQVSNRPTIAFNSAEEAWFWFIRSHQLRRQGVRFESINQSVCRPCDPDDIVRALFFLSRNGQLRDRHLAVLELYGLLGRPPDGRCAEERAASRLWGEALDALHGNLVKKGVIR